MDSYEASNPLKVAGSNPLNIVDSYKVRPKVVQGLLNYRVRPKVVRHLINSRVRPKVVRHLLNYRVQPRVVICSPIPISVWSFTLLFPSASGIPALNVSFNIAPRATPNNAVGTTPFRSIHLPSQPCLWYGDAVCNAQGEERTYLFWKCH